MEDFDAPAQAGGRRYGEGMKGETLDAGCRARGDAHTLCQRLRALVAQHGEGGVRVQLHGPRTALRTLERDVLGVADALGHGGAGLLAKVFKGGDAPTAFARELRGGRAVRAAFAAQGQERLLTIAPARLRLPSAGSQAIMGLVAWAGGRQGLHATLQERCAHEMRDRFASDAELRGCVRDVLAGLAALQAGGRAHGDVKMDNIVFCPADGRFKLIDWELSVTIRELRGRYLGRLPGAGTRKPLPLVSPVAFYTWGMPRPLAVATFVGHFLIRHRARVLGGPGAARIRERVWQAAAAAERFLAEAERAGRSRAALFDACVRGFDLFNFGVVLMIAVERSGGGTLSAAMRSRALDLVRRILHHDAPDRLRTPAEALAAFGAR